jgi:hypothetical protein
MNATTTKVKLYTGAVLCAALVVASIGGTLLPLGSAQDRSNYSPPKSGSAAADTKSPYQPKSGSTAADNKKLQTKKDAAQPKQESDEEFIRRVSKDLRESDPTPAEVHFFLANKDPRKRQTLIDLFIQERQAKKTAEKIDRLIEKKVAADAQPEGVAERERLARWLGVLDLVEQSHAKEQGLPAALQKALFEGLQTAKTRGDVAKLTQTYLDGLCEYLKVHPDGRDAAEAIRQIVLIYESQGKSVEADAWRAKLPRDTPKANRTVTPKTPGPNSSSAFDPRKP